MTEHEQVTCPVCGGLYEWTWEEAFDKFGYGDGDGLIMTGDIVEVLTKLGYAPECIGGGVHNEYITDLWKDGGSIIPDDVKMGYDDPRCYLPRDLIAQLDKAFPLNRRKRR